MKRCGLLAFAFPMWVAAQPPVPTINPGGIVRADTTRPGLLAPGIAFSVWGHNYGPKTGCRGPAMEVCGVRILLDGAPIQVLYTSDVLVNARMPDAPGAAVSRLVVVSGGRRSDPVEVRRLPETAVISLDGVARVDGPIWIHVELPHGGVSYPSLGPGDFACDAFEVRRDGKMLVSIAPPPGRIGGSGPSCPGYANQGKTAPVRTGRLPLHLQYNLAEPGVYEVRLLHYGFLFRAKNDLRAQSAWTPITVLPAVPRTVGPHPQDPDELLTDFLPNLLAMRDDETLSILVEYLYHPSQRVRGWAASALHYWPEDVVEARLMAAFRANGPSDVVVYGLGKRIGEVADLALPYLFSEDPVLFQGAVRAAGSALAPNAAIDPAVRMRVEKDLANTAVTNLGHVDAQMANDVIALLGQIHNQQVHDLLWTLVDRHTGTEQALIAPCMAEGPEGSAAPGGLRDCGAHRR